MPRLFSTWSCSTSDKHLVELDIDHLNAAGDGVARRRRQVVTIPFTIPGERVRVSVRRSADGTLVGAVEEILRPSPHRTTPLCPHFGAQRRGGCGGCAWQHISYTEQLRLKSALVTRLVRDAVPAAPAASAMIPGVTIEAPWGYRQKVHFVFGAGDRRAGASMGHYARGSRRVIPVVACPVHDQQGNAIAFRLRDALEDSGITTEHAGLLKGIAVRVGANTGETMATLVLTDAANRRLRAVSRQIATSVDGPSSFHVNIHPRGDGYIFGRETRHIAGSARLREEIAGISFLLSPTAFFQTNVRAAEILARLVVAAVPPRSRVLDLYAGAGLFALPLAGKGHHVVAVEENRNAVADGEASRRLNAIDEQQCRFVARRVEDALRAPGQRVDAVVLDPPRVGCSPLVIKGIFQDLRPPLAIYVSCNPEALAHDLRDIVRRDYEVTSLQPVDMFPHTAHIETVVTLRRVK